MGGMSGMLKALGRGGKVTKESIHAAEAQRDHPEITYDSKGAGWVSGYAILHKSRKLRYLTLKACQEEAARMRSSGSKGVYTVVDRWQICEEIKAKATNRKAEGTAKTLKGTKLTRIQQKHLKDYGYVNVTHNKKRYRLTPSRVKRGIIQR